MDRRLSGLSFPRLSTMGAHVHPHLGVCLWLWLGVTLGLGQEQGKDKGWGLWPPWWPSRWNGCSE